MGIEETGRVVMMPPAYGKASIRGSSLDVYLLVLPPL
jgi:hypothetical protein